MDDPEKQIPGTCDILMSPRSERLGAQQHSEFTLMITAICKQEICQDNRLGEEIMEIHAQDDGRKYFLVAFVIFCSL